MQYHPPPLFKQGTSARVKVILFSLIAILLLVIDARVQSLHMMRQAIGSVLYPLQMLALVPRDIARDVGDYFARLSTLEQENTTLKHNQLAQTLLVQQGQQLQLENAQLRRLLGATESLDVNTVMATILYDARDNFNRRIIVDRGQHHGVTNGQPVIDDQGVVGQVTRVFPLTSEVRLLTDKDQAIPVQVQRNGLRSIVYGKGQTGKLEMRMPNSADIKVGDVLVTSSIDGIYPSGLSVARVAKIESDTTSTFERVVCVPLAGLDRRQEVLILLSNKEMDLRPADEQKNNGKKINRRITRDGPETKEGVTQ